MEFDVGAYVSGFSGIVSGVGLLLFLLRDYRAQLKEVRRDMGVLKDERVAAIERRMKEFESGCALRHDRLQETLNKVEHMAADLNNLVGWTKKLDGKLDLLGQDAAAARATAEAQKVWLANLDKSHNDHVHDREAHRNG